MDIWLQMIIGAGTVTIIYKAYVWADKYMEYRLINSDWNGKRWVYRGKNRNKT